MASTASTLRSGWLRRTKPLPSQPFTPTRDFVERLTSYDQWLRVRWGYEEGRWRIERKVAPTRPMPPDPHITVDDWKCFQDGCCLIMKLLPNQLDGRVFYTLFEGDMHRRGGADAVANELDDDYVTRARKQRQSWGEYVEHQAREAYRYMNRPRVIPESQRHTAPKGGMSIGGGW